MTEVTFAPIDLRTAEGMLQCVASDERETWLAVGMALKHEFGDAAFEAYDSWSAGAANYNARAVNASWRGFRAKAGGYTIGTLIKLAKDGGYRFDSSSRPSPEMMQAAEQRRLQRMARIRDEQNKREAQAGVAEHVALFEWRAALREGTSPYVVKKGIAQPEGVRYTPEGGLLLPMMRYDLPREQSMKGLQTIGSEGTKKFTFGVAKTGCSSRLGLLEVGKPLIVCEGWATGMSLRMAQEAIFGSRKVPVFVAFDAYNLVSVVDHLYAMHRSSPILICADDDHATQVAGMASNTGKIQAQMARDAVQDQGARRVMYTAPVFSKPRGPKDTDFNDLQRLEGLAEVSAQLGMALEILETLS
jgi:putative DNA primase/helicase